jgi:ketosteroid isomerase-like protein
MRSFLSGCLLLISLSGFAQDAPLPSVKLPADLDRVLRDYEQGWQNHDAARLATLFTEDGFVLANGKPPVRGRDAITVAYAKSGGPLHLRALAYATSGDVGYLIGAYSYGDDPADVGKFNLALRRVKGRWLIAADMDNSNKSRTAQ